MIHRKSAQPQAEIGRLIPQVVQVHGGIDQQDFLVLLGLLGHFQAELVRPREALVEAPVVQLYDLPHLQIHLVVYPVLDVRAVAAPAAREKYALLAVAALNCVKELLGLPRQDLNFGIRAAENVARQAPALHPEYPQDASGLVGHDQLVLGAGHVLDPASEYKNLNLQGLYATEIS